MPSLLKPFHEVIHATRDANYDYFGRSVIFYPTENIDAPVYVVTGIFLALPLEFNQLDSRIIGGETHLSVRMSEFGSSVRLERWQVVLLDGESRLVFGEVDSVLTDETQGVLNILYKRKMLTKEIEQKASKGGYLR